MSKNWGVSVCQLPCKAVIVSNPSLPLFHSAPLLKQMSRKVKMLIAQQPADYIGVTFVLLNAPSLNHTQFQTL